MKGWTRATPRVLVTRVTITRYVLAHTRARDLMRMESGEGPVPIVRGPLERK